jgi:hypothetical protein
MALAEGEAPGAGDGGPGDGGSGGGAGGGGGQAPDPAQTQQESSGFRLTLTEEQKAKLLADGSLDLSDEQYTGGVRSQMETLRQRAKAAEKKLTDIAAAQQETERKTLEEQKKFQTLYETERTARETDRVARKEDLVKSRFLLAATKAGVINPDDAFVIARTLPGFGAVQVDDEGKVSGLEDLLTALVKDKPYLVAQPQKPTTVGGPSNPGQSGSERPAPKTVAEAGDALADWALRHA